MMFTGGLETFFTIPQQVFLFLSSVLAGAALGMVFDIFRAIRIIFPFMRKNLPTAAADIIFMLIFGIAVFLLSAYLGRGQVRFFYCAGAFLGAALYILTVGNVVTSAIKEITDFISDILKKHSGAPKK